MAHRERTARWLSSLRRVRWIVAGRVVVMIAASALPGSPGAAAMEPGVLEVFVREGCGHCADAKAFLPAFAAERPGLRVVYRDIERDPDAADALIAHSRAAGRAVPAVPTFVIDGRVMVGFVSAELTGPALATLVDARPPSAAERMAGGQSGDRRAIAWFSLGMGTLDGLNACVMWALLYLLSLLVHLRERARIALLAGTFVVASAALHFLMMTGWVNLFALARTSTAVQRAVGLAGLAIGLVNLKEAAAPGRGPWLSVPASAKPGIGARMRAVLAARSLPAALAAVVALAVVVNVAELLCTAGLPAAYSARVAEFDLPPAAVYGQLALYMAGYLAPSTALAAGAVGLLSSPKLTVEAGRWLKGLSGVAMLAMAAWLLWPRGGG
jgi:glutaredoxin